MKKGATWGYVQMSYVELCWDPHEQQPAPNPGHLSANGNDNNNNNNNNHLETEGITESDADNTPASRTPMTPLPTSFDTTTRGHIIER